MSIVTIFCNPDRSSSALWDDLNVIKGCFLLPVGDGFDSDHVRWAKRNPRYPATRRGMSIDLAGRKPVVRQPLVDHLITDKKPKTGGAVVLVKIPNTQTIPTWTTTESKRR